MLIFCCNISLHPSVDIDALLTIVGHWLTQKTRASFSATDLRRDGERSQDRRWSVQWQADAGDRDFWFSTRYAHPDAQTIGRDWITEIGVHKGPDRFACTVLLRTHEDSPLIDSPVQTTRPQVVERILATCAIASGTCGGPPTPLRTADADFYLHLVNNPSRDYPLVQISHTSSGHTLLDPERAASLLAGIASGSVIPADVDTFSLSDALSSRFCCYHGAVNIIWPAVVSNGEAFVPNTRIMSDQVRRVTLDGGSPEGELLATICLRTNRANLRQHTSPEIVRGVKNRSTLAIAQTTGHTTDAELAELYRKVDVDQAEQIASLKADLLRVTAESEANAAKAEGLRLDNESLRTALARTPAAGHGEAGLAVEALRTQLLKSMAETPTLASMLDALERAYPNRLVILDTARESAREAADFKFARKAFDLLHKLVREYYDLKVNGVGDVEARKVFGNESFAAGESETAESNRRAIRLRTFEYGGEHVRMMMHLKIGNKPSKHETFRAHFAWDDLNRKIVIGHCGKHLDHN